MTATDAAPVDSPSAVGGVDTAEVVEERQPLTELFQSFPRPDCLTYPPRSPYPVRT
jgi:hypothetical protein